jgi:hypothetical protein
MGLNQDCNNEQQGKNSFSQQQALLIIFLTIVIQVICQGICSLSKTLLFFMIREIISFKGFCV